MKPLRLFPALLLVLIASCQKEQTNDVLNTQGLTISSRTMAMNGGTAVEATWSNGDCMGVFFGDNESAVEFSYNEGAWSTATTSVSASSTIAAYTPWSDELDRNNVTILADQSSAENIRKSDFLYAEDGNATIENNALNLTFDHRLSQLIVKYTYTGGLDAANAPVDVKILNQPLTYSKTDNTWGVSGNTNSEITPLVNHKSGDDGSTGTIEAILVPHTVASGTEFMTFTINEIPYTITSKGWDFISKKNTTINLSIGPDNAQILDVKCSSEWQVTEASGSLTEISAGYEEVNGTYHIYNAKGLKAWRTAASSNSTVNAKLMNDINLTDGLLLFNREYNGNFDGNSKTISNVKFSVTENKSVGFISYLGTFGTVKNLNLVVEDFTINTGSYSSSIGMIAGENKGSVTNCNVTVKSYNMGSGTINGGYTGGIVGKNTGTVTDCTLGAECEIKGYSAASGIIGWSDNAGATSIKNCHVYSMNGKRAVITAINGTSGGIIGEMKDSGSTIEACSVDADIKIEAGKEPAGIVGRFGNNSFDFNINGCYYNGKLTSPNTTLAGIVGSSYNQVKHLYITSCYTIVTSENNNLQGIIGSSVPTARTVKASYSTAKCGTNVGINVDVITDEQATVMNGSLTHWKYVAAPEGNVFPFVIQPKN